MATFSSDKSILNEIKLFQGIRDIPGMFTPILNGYFLQWQT